MNPKTLLRRFIGVRRYYLVLPALFISAICQGQSLESWKETVNWDGASDWWEYLIVSPKYFGPNALSVPLINNGSTDSVTSLSATANFHFSKGDNTQNIAFYGNYTTPNNTISIDAQFTPYEQFQMSHEKKTERRVYYQNYYMKNTVGDVIVNTTFRLFQKWRPEVGLAMRIGFRMPSGGGLGAARYADVPGYWIDAGAGIPFKNKEWKWIGMLGFLVWQTNSDVLRQNDAFLFGTGVELNRNNLRVQAYGAGYLGYKNNGDKPVVMRLNIEKKQNHFVYLLRFQQGMHDFSYFTAETGVKFLFK